MIVQNCAKSKTHQITLLLATRYMAIPLGTYTQKQPSGTDRNGCTEYEGNISGALAANGVPDSAARLIPHASLTSEAMSISAVSSPNHNAAASETESKKTEVEKRVTRSKQNANSGGNSEDNYDTVLDPSYIALRIENMKDELARTRRPFQPQADAQIIMDAVDCTEAAKATVQWIDECLYQTKSIAKARDALLVGSENQCDCSYKPGL